MSNWIDVTLDVLASIPDEINKIEVALQQPSEELIAWVATKWEENSKDIAASVKNIVTFKPIRNLGCTHPPLNKARRFQNSFIDRDWGVVWSHVDCVSRDFPEALFLASHWDCQASSAGKVVIRAGREIRYAYDGDQQAQGYDWVLPDIFAPFRAEYENGDEFGMYWDPWLLAMEAAVANLRQRYGAPKEGTTCQSALLEWTEKFEKAADAAERQTMLTDPTCAKCGKRFHICAVCHDWFCDCVKPDSTCAACSKPSGIPSFMLNFIANQQEEVDDGEDFDRAADAAEHDEGLLTDAQIKAEVDKRVVGSADPNWNVDCDDEIPEWHKASEAVEAAAGEGEHYTPYVDYCPECGTFYVLTKSVCGACGTERVVVPD